LDHVPLTTLDDLSLFGPEFSPGTAARTEASKSKRYGISKCSSDTNFF
jgi:hypothetical protein